jgi:hypothetical protein
MSTISVSLSLAGAIVADSFSPVEKTKRSKIPTRRLAEVAAA